MDRTRNNTPKDKSQSRVGGASDHERPGRKGLWGLRRPSRRSVTRNQPKDLPTADDNRFISEGHPHLDSSSRGDADVNAFDPSRPDRQDTAVSGASSSFEKTAPWDVKAVLALGMLSHCCRSLSDLS